MAAFSLKPPLFFHDFCHCYFYQNSSCLLSAHQFSTFNFAQICVLDSYCPTLPLSPYNATNRHIHAHRGNSTTSSHISISVAIPEKKKILLISLNLTPLYTILCDRVFSSFSSHIVAKIPSLGFSTIFSELTLY